MPTVRQRRHHHEYTLIVVTVIDSKLCRVVAIDCNLDRRQGALGTDRQYQRLTGENFGRAVTAPVRDGQPRGPDLKSARNLEAENAQYVDECVRNSKRNIDAKSVYAYAGDLRRY